MTFRSLGGAMLAAIACAAALLAQAQPLDDAEAQAVAEVLDEMAGEGEPGITVGIVRGGGVVLEHYDGLADLSHRTPLGPPSRFNVAFNAKQYVSLTVLELAERGAIDLDADFRTYTVPILIPCWIDRKTRR